MSFFGLGIAGKALDAFQEAENVVSDNIGNVNTPGASRQVAELVQAPPIVGSPYYSTWTGPGTRGDGVLVQSIQRIHQDSYDTLFRGASSSQTFFDVQQSQLSATQAYFSEPQGGISNAFTSFQQSINTLVAQPEDINARAGVLSSAGTLVNTISQTGQAIQSQLAQVVQQTSTLVTKTNGILDQIAALNSQIRASRAVGDNPNTYSDQRDYLIDQLSQLLSTQTSIQSNGSTLVTVNGIALVNDTIAYHLAPPVIGTATNGTAQLKIGLVNDPVPTNPTALPLGSGQLAGYVDLYNNKLVPYGQKLDDFTNALATEVDRITTSSYDKNGVAGIALLQPIVASKAIAAGNIKVGITDPAQVPAGFASTAAGSLVQPLNAQNAQVSATALLTGNPTLANAPTQTLRGSLQISVDGVNRVFTYDTGTNADTIADFVNSFNAGHYGVTASYDGTAQRIVFSRDTSNEDIVQHSQPGYTPTPTFSITDSNDPTIVGASNSLLGVLGAAGLQSAAPATAKTTINGSTTPAGLPTTLTVNTTGITAGSYVTIDAGTANAETVQVTATTATTITAAFKKVHAAGASLSVDPSVTTSTGALAPAATTLTVPATATGITTGSKLQIDPYGANPETVTVTSAAGPPWTFNPPLAFAHAAGVAVAVLPPAAQATTAATNPSGYPQQSTITLAALPPGVAVGSALTLNAGQPNAETVVVTAVAGTTITATFQNAHAAGETVQVNNGVTVNQVNGFGTTSNAAANAVAGLFSQNVGVPGIQTFSATAVAGPFPAQATITESVPPGSLPQFGQVQVGDVLTVDAGTPNQENVVVSAINRTNPNNITFTATFTKPHGAGGTAWSIAAAQNQTLGQAYGSLVTQLGLDAQTAISGNKAQTSLAGNIDKVRQGIDGINIDEETQSLVKFQNAYQAAARTFNVLDSLLNTVINDLGK